MFFIAWILIVNLNNVYSYVNENRIKLKLENNQIIIGNRLKLNNQIVYEFLGVPYAQVPIEEKRFRFPLKLNATLPHSPYDATFNRASCVQLKDEVFKGFYGAEMWNAPDATSEDCLYMNMWFPIQKEFDDILMPQSELNEREVLFINKSLFIDNNSSISTMYWIYGGSFTSGSISLEIYNGSILAAHENVAILSANYRLGPFGFLYLNSSDVPGNAALADQILALEWYSQKYARYFGASTTSITLFGESSGAMSIQYHLMSDKKSMFKNVILQSASALVRVNDYTLAYKKPEDALKVSLKLASYIGCSQISDNEIENFKNFDAFNKFDLTKCLQQTNASVLLNAQYLLDDVITYLPFPFAPTLDYHGYISQNPFEFDYKSISEHNVLVGANSDEGSYFLFYAFANEYFNLDGFINDNATHYDYNFLTDILNKMLIKVNKATENQIVLTSNCISEIYAENVTSMNQEIVWKLLSRILGDIFFTCPTYNFGSLIKTFNFYTFSHRSLSNPWPKWMGVMHGYEIEFVFGIPLLDKFNFTEQDRLVTRQTMSQWALFAKSGSFKENQSDINIPTTCHLFDKTNIEETCQNFKKKQKLLQTRSGLPIQKFLSILSLICNLIILKLNFRFFN